MQSPASNAPKSMDGYHLQRSCLESRLKSLQECQHVLLKDIDKVNSDYIKAKERGLRTIEKMKHEGEKLHRMYEDLLKQMEATAFEMRRLELEMDDDVGPRFKGIVALGKDRLTSEEEFALIYDSGVSVL